MRKRHPTPVAAAPPPPGQAIFRTCVHESLWTDTPGGAACPTGAVRVMTQDQGETNRRAQRCKVLWNAGTWSFPCLKCHWTTEPNGPSNLAAQGVPGQYYEDQVREFLYGTVAQPSLGCDSGGIQRGEIWEVGNEPNSPTGHDMAPGTPGRPLNYTGSADQLLRAIAGSYQLIRDSGRQVVHGHCLGPGNGWSMNRLSSPPDAEMGGARWSMIDGWAFHIYQDQPGSVLAGLNGLRNALDGHGQSAMPIFMTENGWPHDRHNFDGSGGGNYDKTKNHGTHWEDAPSAGGYTSAEQASRLNALWALLLANKERLNLQLWSWFSYADYNPGGTNGYNHCGLVEQDTRATAGPPNYQDAGTAVGWFLHPVPYDGRDKLALASMAAKPKATTFIPT